MKTRQGTVVKKSILYILIIFASTCLWAADEEQFPIQPLDQLQNKIEEYMMSQLIGSNEGTIKVAADKLDSRIKLRVCANNKLEVFNPYNSPLLNTNTMGIKCTEDTNHWTLYVPVRVTVLKTVLLTKQALRRGKALTNEALYSAEMDTQKLKQGYFTNPKDLIGLVCKKDIMPDTPLNPFNVELAKLVLKGQSVSIMAISSNLNISMPGIAMNDGTLGDVIKVKNATSHKIIDAQVSGRQKVKVTL